jgi:membrane associated rhomboid family serine protease
VTGGADASLSERQARLWALVLDARSVPCCIEHDEDGWHLRVPERSLGKATRELRIYEHRNRNWPPPAPTAAPLVENGLVTLSVLVLLASFHNITRLAVLPNGIVSPDWTGSGSARADLILHGQWWRLATALTLHADWLHLASNLAIGGVFIFLLCKELGSGLSWSLLIGAGMLGNLANAWFQRSHHNSLGASTAVFAAVGILAALGAFHHRRHLHRRWLLPVAAALALLALLGTEGENTDLGAHLFGFLFGLLLGLGAEWGVGRWGRPGWLLNALLALIAAGTVVAAWWAALTMGGNGHY